MQEVFFRFPHLSERVFDSLDNKSLANCKEVSKSWYFYLDNQKFLQPRIIKADIKKVEEAVEIVKNIYGYFQPWSPRHPNFRGGLFVRPEDRCEKEDDIMEIFLSWYDGNKYIYNDRCIFNKAIIMHYSCRPNCDDKCTYCM